MIRVKVHSRVLRTIDRLGGVDRYVTGIKPARLKTLGPEGWNLRLAILKSSGSQKLVGQSSGLKREVDKMDKLEEWLAESRAPMLPQEIPEHARQGYVGTQVDEEEIERRLRRRSSHLDEKPPPRTTFFQRAWLAVKMTTSPSTYLPKQ